MNKKVKLDFENTKIEEKEIELKGITLFIGTNNDVEIIMKDILKQSLTINYKYDCKTKEISNNMDFETFFDIYKRPKLDFEKITKSDTLNKLNKFILEEIIVDRYEKYENFDILNSSNSLKKFIILKMMIETDFLNLKDNFVLILTDTESSLHPIWQIKYIEFLVMLTKEFSNIKIVLNTFSPYQLYALKIYKEKYKINDSNASFYNSLPYNRHRCTPFNARFRHAARV